MTTVSAPPARWAVARPWIGTVGRLVLAGVWLAAGASKVGDLAASGRAVAAYQLMPFDAAKALGAALPFIEVALAVLLLVGFATRLAAAASAVLLTAFVVGISSAWARGLRIDCGCFGGGGELAANQATNYLPEILRDVALLAVSVFLVIYPLTRFSVDAKLIGTEDET